MAQKELTRTVLLLPGFREGRASRNYDTLIRTIQQRGYKVVFVPITWKRRALPAWISEFEQVYQRYSAEEVIIAGFSYGAMIALSAAANREPHELWLFSLSPYYADDVSKMEFEPEVGIRRTRYFRNLDFGMIACKVSCKAKLFIGNRELQEVIHRAEKAHQLLENSELIQVPGAEHDPTSNKYLAKISEVI